MAKLHNGGKNPCRMPLILSEEDEKRWLDPSLSEDEIKSLIKPYAAEPLSAYPVSKQFQTMNPLKKELLDKVDIQQKLDL